MAGYERGMKMSDNRNLNNRRSMDVPQPKEVFSPQRELRPTNEFLTDISDNAEDYCVLRCTLPPGAVVPMHSHADRETFYVLSGKPDALREDRWEQLQPGDIFDVQDGAKHAWRNSSETAASMICVTTTRMARFLQEISISAERSSPETQAHRFLELVRENGYWLANAEENAAVGLNVSWGELSD